MQEVKQKVVRRQPNSKMCIICGLENPFGLKAAFYEVEDGSVVTIFRYKEQHQSYPNRCHGGLICAMLDEIIGRAIWVVDPTIWGVTIELSIKYRKVVKYDTDLRAVGKVVKSNARYFDGIGSLYDMEGNLLAEAKARYLRLPLSKISNDGDNHEDINVYVNDEVKEI